VQDLQAGVSMFVRGTRPNSLNRAYSFDVSLFAKQQTNNKLDGAIDCGATICSSTRTGTVHARGTTRVRDRHLGIR